MAFAADRQILRSGAAPPRAYPEIVERRGITRLSGLPGARGERRVARDRQQPRADAGLGAKLGANIPSVIYNQSEGGRLAAQHLIGLGHRQIAEISGPLDNHDGCDRHTAFVDTLKENGIVPGPHVEGDFSLESGYRAMRELLALGQPFTAVFVGNDSMCIGAHTALRERGLRVPDDVSMVGFDDIPEAAHLVPGLTTVRQDFSLLGRLAIEYITGMIETNDTPVHQRVLQPSLITRESTRRL